MKTLLFICLLCSPVPAQEIVSHRDEPLQTTWFIPHKPKEAKGRGGLLAYKWKVFPSIGQTFAQDKKWLDLDLYLAGVSRAYTTDLVFAVDGSVTTIRDVSWARKQPDFNYWDTAVLRGQEALIRKIAKANEVWVTASTSGGRTSVKLSPTQLAVFTEMLEKYDSLNPR